MLLLGLLLAGKEPCFPQSVPTNFVIHVWQAENGLPQNSVTAVAQTSDGYIWIGTYSALARFDGVRFTIFDTGNTPGLHSSRVTSLFEAEDGTLWIGDEDGVLTQLRSGRFESVDFQPPWSDRNIFRIGADDAGDLWLVNRGGLLTRLKDSLSYAPAASASLGAVNVSTLPRGLWVIDNGTVSTVQQGKLTPLKFDGLPQENYVQGVCPGSQGGLWVANNGKLREWDGGHWTKDLGQAPWPMGPLTAMLRTRSGFVVGGTADQGLYLVSDHGEVLHFGRTNGLPSDWVTSAIEDREGNLWVGTRGGLAMLHSTSVATVGPPDRWQGFPVLSVTAGEDDGEIWAATEGAGLYHLKHDQWSHFEQASGLANLFVWSVSRDTNGLIWAGTWGGGVFVGKNDVFNHVPGLDSNLQALAVFHEADGVTWLGTSAGLLRYESNQAEWIVRAPMMTMPDVRCIVRDNAGTLWFGMFGGGLGRYKAGEFQQYRKSDGLPSDFIQCLRADADGSLWIGTFGGGLARLKQGQFAVIGRNQGLPSNDIGYMDEDGQGFFWMSSHNGVLRVRKTDLVRCADGLSQEIYCQLFAVNDGLPTVECSGGLQPAGCKTPDGRLWFPTSEGLVTIDPESVHANPLPPPVIIERLLVDGQVTEAPTNHGTRLRIPPGRHRVELQYTALSYIAPERVRFKYRLNGLDKDWISAGTSRAANYGYIPPGSYSFQVIACNNDAVWNLSGAQTAFVVLPYFWQTPWFRFLAEAMALATVGGIAWQDARRRMRRKLERIEQQRAIEHERARIAHDIHDDLGVHLTRISLLSDPVRIGADHATHAAKSLNQIHGSARELTRAMDEIVWAANPQHDSLDSLANYLQRFAQEFLEQAHLRCRLDIPIQLPAWPLSAEVRHNLFLAFKESLNNAVKHARASEVRVALTLEAAVFCLIVEDDGCGFAMNSPQEGTATAPAPTGSGNGLKNIRRRMEQIGGHCEIQRLPGQGTRVKFVVPMKLAK